MNQLDHLFRLADESAAEGVSLLAELIRFETVNTGVMPTGNELPLCRWLQGWLAKEGISARIFESGETRANLVARLPGSAGSPSLLYMGHVDVVPVENPQDWRYPPFSATVAGGRMWGRGAEDMKSMVAAELMAMALLRRAGVQLRGDLIVAAAADEESGGKYGFGWLAQNAPEAIRADYAVNEGGAAYSISLGEKGRYELRVTLRGSPTHAASPWDGDNVSFKLGEILRRLENWRAEINVAHEFFGALAEMLGRAAPITAENVDALADELAKTSRGLGSAARGLSRMTLTPTMFHGGVKSNSVLAEGSLVCDIRALPWQDETYARKQVEGVLEGMEGVSYELIVTAASNSSPYDTRLKDSIQKATAAASGREDLKWLPDLVTGFTDARLVRPLGTVVYGFGPGRPDMDLMHPSGVHGTDESCELGNLLFMTKVFLALAVDLLE